MHERVGAGGGRIREDLKVDGLMPYCGCSYIDTGVERKVEWWAIRVLRFR